MALTEGELALLDEVRKLREEVSEIRTGLGELNHRTERLSDQHGDLGSRFERIELGVSGDGNGTPGLRLRVDRLEQSIKTVSGMAKAGLVGFLGAVTEFIRSQIK